jgi:hypothetical protein
MAQKRAWPQLAEPSVTRFDRRELRNYVSGAEAAPRTGFEKTLSKG